MIKEIVFYLASLLTIQGHYSCLAPFPIYATPLGKPYAQRIEVEGKLYCFIWDGKSIDLIPLDEKDKTPNREVMINFIRKALDAKMDEVEREMMERPYWWERIKRWFR